MDALTGKLGDVMEKLGRSFLIAGYLPAALFVLVNQLALFPHWLGKSALLFQTQVPPADADAAWRWTYLIDQGVTMLALPLLLGILLLGLNTLIIKVYEGAFEWQRRFLLLWFQERNERQAEALFGKVVKLKDAYNDVLKKLRDLPPGTEQGELEQDRASIAIALQEAHEEIRKAEDPQLKAARKTTLPRRIEMVRPTELGNVFAEMEEYPYERYGMDGVLFWPRLRPLLDESLSATLVNTKIILDLLLNLSLLALVFGLEAIVLGVASKLGWGWIVIGVGTWLLAFAFYRGAVSAAHSMGDTVKLCFDLHRGKLWKSFGFPPPASLEQEQGVWLLLGQFLRRGEGFFFPHLPKPEDAAK